MGTDNTMRTLPIPFFLLLMFCGMTACRIVETASPPMTVRLAIHAPRVAEYDVYRTAGAGQFERIAPIAPGRFVASIPQMDGGHKEFLCVQYDTHDPMTYGVIRLQRGNTVVRELSLSDIAALPRDANGYSIIAHRPADVPDSISKKNRSRP